MPYNGLIIPRPAGNWEYCRKCLFYFLETNLFIKCTFFFLLCVWLTNLKSHKRRTIRHLSSLISHLKRINHFSLPLSSQLSSFAQTVGVFLKGSNNRGLSSLSGRAAMLMVCHFVYCQIPFVWTGRPHFTPLTLFAAPTLQGSGPQTPLCLNLPKAP